jgi:hypothetical protein
MKWLPYWLDCFFFVTWIQITWPFRHPDRPTYFPEPPPMPGHEWPIPWARHIRNIVLRTFMRAYHRPRIYFSKYTQLVTENMHDNLFCITDPAWWLDREPWLNEPPRIQLKLFLLASRKTW